MSKLSLSLVSVLALLLMLAGAPILPTWADERQCLTNPDPGCLLSVAMSNAQDIDDGVANSAVAHEIAIALQEIIDDQVQAGDITGARATARSLGDYPSLRAPALVKIAEVQAQAQAGDITGAFATAWSFRNANLRGPALAKIAEVQVQAEDVTNALITVQGIESPHRRIGALVTIAKRLAELEGENLNFAIPTEWLQDLKDETEAGSRRQQQCLTNPTHECLLSIAASIAQGLEHWDSRGWALRDISRFQAQTGDIAGALATVQYINDKRTAWGRDDALKNAAVAQAQAGDITGALATAVRIENTGGRNNALQEIAKVQAQAGKIEDALAIAGRIDRASKRNFVLAEVQAQAGDIADALVTAQRLDDSPFVRGSALERIVEVQAQMGDITGALATAGRIDYASVRDHALLKIADVQAQAGDTVGALAAAERINHASRRDNALKNIVEIQAQAGDISGALATAERINHSDLRSVFLAKVQVQAGDVTGALISAQGIKRSDYKSTAFVFIAKRLAEMEEE